MPTFLLEPSANLATVGLVWAFSGDSGIAWGGLLLLVGLGMVRDAIQTRRLRGSFPRPRHLLYSPLKDIMMLPLWFDAIMNRRVQWRGHRFLVGRMTRLRLATLRARCDDEYGESAGFAPKTRVGTNREVTIVAPLVQSLAVVVRIAPLNLAAQIQHDKESGFIFPCSHRNGG